MFRDVARLVGRQGEFVAFHAAAEDFARADVPASIFKVFMMANMTALEA